MALQKQYGDRNKYEIPKDSRFSQVNFQYTHLMGGKDRQNPLDTLINPEVLTFHIILPYQPIPSSAHCHEIRENLNS